jgi:hypothetical protein
MDDLILLINLAFDKIHCTEGLAIIVPVLSTTNYIGKFLMKSIRTGVLEIIAAISFFRFGSSLISSTGAPKFDTGPERKENLSDEDFSTLLHSL